MQYRSKPLNSSSELHYFGITHIVVDRDEEVIAFCYDEATADKIAAALEGT